MNHRAASRILSLILLVLTAGGCTTAQITDEPMVLDVSPPMAVDVDLFRGDVILRVNPKLTETSVTVTRVATHGAKRRKEAKASLQEIQYSADVIAGELGPVVQVRASTTHAEPHFQHVNVFIDSPEIAGVKIRTRNGRVVARDVTGPIDVSTSYEYVRIMTRYAITEPVTILNSEGDIDYRVRGDSTARLDCVAIGGHASMKARFGEVVVYPESDSDTLRADLNNGNNDVVLRTVNGDIRVVVIDEPAEVGLTIVD